jgi:hypothetical protein
MEIFQNVFDGVFELPLLRNAQKRHFEKRKKPPTSFSGYLSDTRCLFIYLQRRPCWPNTSEHIEGLAKTIRRTPTPRTSAKSQTHPPTCRLLFCFVLCFFVRFRRYSVRGVSRTSKTPYKYFCKKFHVEKQFDKISMSVFPRVFFGFIAFLG